MKNIYFLLLILFTIFPVEVLASDVHVYLFYGNTCSVCESERMFLESLDNIKIHEFEVFDNNDNYNLMVGVKKLYNITREGVPFTVVGDVAILGFNDSRKNRINKLINKYQENDYYDRTGIFLGLYEDEIIEEENTINDNIENKAENGLNPKKIIIFGLILISSLVAISLIILKIK